MKYINNIKILFKAIFKRFKGLLPVFNIYTLHAFRYLNKKIKKKKKKKIKLKNKKKK